MCVSYVEGWLFTLPGVDVDVAVERGSAVHDATWCNMMLAEKIASIDFLPSAPSGGIAN